MFGQSLAVLALTAGVADAYFILSHPILETTRLDPPHVHSIVGGSNFDKTIDYNSTLLSSCTTAPISIDKSNYWTPQLYYYNPDGATFQMIPAAGVNTYYLPRYGPENKVYAPPKGLRMISGNPYRRDFVEGDPNSEAISFVCLDYSGSHQNDPDWAQRNSFFTHNCPNGMRAQVNFPTCWDGVNLDSNDHSSHMAWPTGGANGGGSCPSSHPVHIVQIFYEFIYNVQDFPFNNASVPTWVFANGDTTGYGMHGDFVMGWEDDAEGNSVLQAAIDQCNQDNGVGGELNNCPPFVPYLQSGDGCRGQNDFVNEDIGSGHPIAKLPGDNPIWIGNGTKPSYGNYSDAGISYTDGKSTIPDGYVHVGCIAEGSSGRALTGSTWVSKNMTRGTCVAHCEASGFPLAGIEYGEECYCGYFMVNGASNTTLLDESKCGSVCAANTNENCGGSSTLDLFNNPSMYPQTPLPAGWTDNGCFTDATSGRALSAYSFTSSAMTPALCLTGCQARGYVIGGIEYSSECYCGNKFNAGSLSADPTTCSMACSGDPAQRCGGSSRLSTFTYSNSTSIYQRRKLAKWRV
ncbi:uncharacterized protein IL334_005763 [Kwoniella shivajii]|uniref:WSC domain-containing protein n=1 Tax=Kwoniella shivajii TaxID=564305 RepID=A0ABZ1D416_9TREE|nr:hypothetical protein IL334_005763 [Kwoniella shivajii]